MVPVYPGECQVRFTPSDSLRPPFSVSLKLLCCVLRVACEQAAPLGMDVRVFEGGDDEGCASLRYAASRLEPLHSMVPCSDSKGDSKSSSQSLPRSVIERRGELVCLTPFPSMPLKFWGDEVGINHVRIAVRLRRD